MSMGGHEPTGEQPGGMAPAGWYPVEGGMQRYWDGSQWTDQTAPAGPGPAAAPGPNPDPMAGAYVPQQQAYGAPGATTNDDRSMAMLAHLLGILLGFLGPIIIWAIKKDQSAFVDDQGKEAINFQLTLLIAWLVTIVASFVLIGLLFIPVLLIVGIVMPIIGGLAANKGEYYRYPATIRFIK